MVEMNFLRIFKNHLGDIVNHLDMSNPLIVHVVSFSNFLKLSKDKHTLHAIWHDSD